MLAACPRRCMNSGTDWSDISDPELADILRQAAARASRQRRFPPGPCAYAKEVSSSGSETELDTQPVPDSWRDSEAQSDDDVTTSTLHVLDSSDSDSLTQRVTESQTSTQPVTDSDSETGTETPVPPSTAFSPQPELTWLNEDAWSATEDVGATDSGTATNSDNQSEQGSPTVRHCS